MQGFETISGEYFTLAAGVDTTPLFIGLDGDRCQCPHWGFVLCGQLTTTDASGVRETVTANDLFYWPPGHNVKVDADAEIIMFSPQRAHSRVLDHMIAAITRCAGPSRPSLTGLGVRRVSRFTEASLTP